jgi:hypothetical protein
MHNHTKKQLKRLDAELGDYIYEQEMRKIEKFLQQALKSQAEIIRAEMVKTIGNLNGLEGCEGCISKVNKQKANLDELINSFK